MRRCPECGEPVAKGQTHCFACGSDFILSPARSRFLGKNTIFVALVLGGCILAVLFALLITQPKPKSPVNQSNDYLARKSDSTKQQLNVTQSKVKKMLPGDDIEAISQELAELEGKITALERIAQTEDFTKDEKDALRFARILLDETKATIGSLKAAKTEEEKRRLIRQIRVKQNEINQFLFILKKRSQGG